MKNSLLIVWKALGPMALGALGASVALSYPHLHKAFCVVGVL